MESDGLPLVRSLRHRLGEPWLLLLDNFEHLLAGAPRVAELLGAVPTLKLLVTSRAPLRLAGEQEFPVAPLALPDLDRLPSLEDLARVAAVDLFAQRARAVHPQFRLCDANAAAVASICVRLDGLPLAIELAASRIRLLSPQELLARLSNQLLLLTDGRRDLPARQQTLRNTIDWSYDLLEPPQQLLLARSAIFVGGFTLAAAEAVASELKIENEQLRIENAEGTVLNSQFSILNSLAALVAHSMILRGDTPDGESRFAMLEVIREYALERLDARGEAHALRLRHARYYLALAEESEPALPGPAQAVWLRRLAREHDNMRAALGWLLEQQLAEAAVRLAGALGRFWEAYDYLREGREWLVATLSLPGAATLPARARAKALHAVGTLALHQSDYAAARDSYAASLALCRVAQEQGGCADALGGLGAVAFRQGDYVAAQVCCAEGLAISRALGDQRRIADAVNGLGRVVWAQGDAAQAARLHAEGLALSRAIGYTGGIAWSHNALGEIARSQGNYAGAAAHFAESLARFRELGDPGASALALQNLAYVLLAQGAYQQAESYFAETLAIWQRGYARHGTALCLIGLAGVACATGRPQRAARLLGAAEALIDDTGARLETTDRADYDRILAAVAARLAPAALAASRAAGCLLPLDQLLASEEPATGAVTNTPQPPANPAGLTAREVDVLRLVAAGLTNPQVAERLVISHHTVTVHLRSIYAKLGVSSRTAAARFAVDHGLV